MNPTLFSPRRPEPDDLPKRRDPGVPARTIPEDKFSWLGKPIGGRQYGRHRDSEYAVDIRPAELDAFTAGPGEIIVSRKHIEMIDGSPWPSTSYHRGFPVATGTYAALAAKARRPKAEQSPRAWDRLGALPLMQRREPMRLATGRSSPMLDRMPVLPAISSDEQEALAQALDMADRTSQSQLIEVGGNEPPERSVAGVIAYLARRGIDLELVRGRLLARSRLPIRVDLRELIEQAEELIVGHLQGKPVICSSCAEPAVTIVFPQAPMCAEHAQ